MKRLLIAIPFLLLFLGVAQAACPAGSTCENYTGTIPYSAAGSDSSKTRTPAVRASDHGINVRDVGCVGNNSADDTVCFQAAIDCSFGTDTTGYTSGCSGNTSGRVFCPSGQYVTNLPIFLDPPGNLRGTSFAAPYTYRAAYNSLTAYSANDVVQSNGGVSGATPINWVALTSTTGNAPSISSTFWTPVIANGAGLSISQSPALIGVGGVPGDIVGCIIKPQYNNAVGLYTSPANSTTIQDVGVYGKLTGATNGANYRCGMPSAGIGIGLIRNSSGDNFVRVKVKNFYYSFYTGLSGDGGGSENMFIDVTNDNACVGIDFAATQNFSNTFIHGGLCGTTGAVATSNQDVRIYGGTQWGVCGEGTQKAHFTIGTTSSLTAAAGGVFTFSTTLAASDVYMDTCDGLAATFGPLSTGASQDLYVPCVYNAFVIVTDHFGAVPLLLTAYNKTTKVASFQTLYVWSNDYFGNVTTPLTNTDLQAEIQASVDLYAAEEGMFFFGGNISVNGLHAEITNGSSGIFNAYTGFGGSEGGAALRDSFFNSDFSIPQCAPNQSGACGSPPSAASVAGWLAANLFPMFRIQHGLLLDNVDMGTNVNSHYLFDYYQTAGGTTGNSNAVNLRNFGEPNLRVTPFSAASFTGTNETQCPQAYGCGIWDKNYMQTWPNNSIGYGSDYNYRGLSSSPMWGTKPAYTVMPRLSPSDISTLLSCTGGPPLTCSPPAISPTGYTYPPLTGDTFYNVMGFNIGAPSKALMHSNHIGYSWGQDLTGTNVTGLNWHYKGQSFAVYLCATPPLAPANPAGTCSANETASFNLLFPGLVITLDNGAGAKKYMVRHLYPQLGYFTVINAEQDGSPYLLVGTKTVVYSCPNAGGGGANQCPGAVTIGQQAYSITEY